MVDKSAIISVHTNILKTAKDIKKLRANKYLSPIKNKVWKKVAEDYIIFFSDITYEILSNYKKDVVKLINVDKPIFNKCPNIEKSSNKTKNYKTHEYLDKWYNNVVVDDIRDELVELNNRYNKELEKAFNQHIQQGYNREATTLVYKEIGMEFNFNKFDKHTSKYLNDKKVNWAKQVSQTNEYLVKKALNKGFEDGLDTYDIAKLIEGSTGFNYTRAEAIARTEILISSNYIDYVSYMQNENIVKVWWSSTTDDRTRKSHEEANRKEVVKGEPFIVGGHKLKFPGDGSLGAPAKEIINCRCIIRPIFRRENTEQFTNNIDSNINNIHNETINLNEFKFVEKLSKQTGLTESYRHAITTRFSNGTELAQALFLKYVPDNSVADTRHTGGAHYNSVTKDINMDFEEDLNNPRGSGTTYFHEHGHLIDGVYGFLSIKTNFTDILKKEYENFIKSYMKDNKIKTKREAYTKIKYYLWENDKHLLSSISDLLGGLSKYKIKGPYMHDEHYWKNVHMIGLEAFAHFFEAQFDKERLKVLEKHFPLSSKVFIQYMQALNNLS